ncbi:MAG: hypothetical protein NTX40_03620 [Planctomycetota bacterium]|nr:hypothetical protein [Planctomycetota bacterium]
MKRLLVMGVAAVLACAGLASRATSQEPTRTDLLHAAEARLRTEKDPEHRQELADRIERYKHELGPHDEKGTALHPSAMWHATAIGSLKEEVQRLEGRPKSTPAAAFAVTLRIHTRRMAATCLERGWDWGGERPRFQFDAFGSYLANNLGAPDSLGDALASWIAKEASLASGPSGEAFKAALADAQAALGRLGEAVGHFTRAPSRREVERMALMADLGQFAQALDTLGEAKSALEALQAKASGGGAGAAGRESAAPEAPQVTEDDKARLEKIRRLAAGLEGPVWATIRSDLERFARVAESALGVRQTRTKALDLVEHLELAAQYAQDLAQSKSAYPEYLDRERGGLEHVLQLLGEKSRRQEGYASIRRMQADAHARRVLDASPLEPAVCQKVLRAYAVPKETFPQEGRENSWEEFRGSLSRTIATLEKMPAWSSETVADRLVGQYPAFSKAFLDAVGRAGKSATPSAEGLRGDFLAAAGAGRDLERIVWANRAVKSVAKYVPSRADPMATELGAMTVNFQEASPEKRQHQRENMDRYIRPFRPLADFQPPGPEHAREASRLTGGLYQRAVMKFSQDASNGIEEASKGLPTALDAAMAGRWMFVLLRHRCLAEAESLAKADPASLIPFCVPPKQWDAFLAATDKQLRGLFSQYLVPKAPIPGTGYLADWDTVYCTVAAAQRMTLQEQKAEETDLDRLLGNLYGVADPDASDAAVLGWATGYHTTEASMALVGGFGGTARWHLYELDQLCQTWRMSRPFTAEQLEAANPKAAKGAG